MDNIIDHHFHIYFDNTTFDKARAIASAMNSKFNVDVGNFHEKNVGPHPRWSVRVLVPQNLYGEALLWMALRRDQLTVFIHPNSGDDLKDHTDYAVWMGECLDLNLTVFNKD